MKKTVIDAKKLMDNFGIVSSEFHENFLALKEKQDDCVGTGSLCVKEEFFRQETNIKLFLNDSKQCTPLGMIIKLNIITIYIINLFIIGITPKRKQFDYPDFVNTTLRREITQHFMVDYTESLVSSTPSPVISSEEISLNGSESNLPSKENSPKAFKVIIL